MSVKSLMYNVYLKFLSVSVNHTYIQVLENFKEALMNSQNISKFIMLKCLSQL